LPHYATACNLHRKLRSAIATPHAGKIGGIVEFGLTRANEPQQRVNRRSGPLGTIIAGAIEVIRKGQNASMPVEGELRLGAVVDRSSESLAHFINENVLESAVVLTSERLRFGSLPNCSRLQYPVQTAALTHISRAFRGLMTWLEERHCELSQENASAILNEFVFRHRHRSSQREAFHALLGIPTEEESRRYFMRQFRGEEAHMADFSTSLA
jgi:hypothetical protein